MSMHSRRLSRAEVRAARSALIGLQSLPDYAPANSAYSADRLARLGQAMEEARQDEVRAVSVEASVLAVVVEVGAPRLATAAHGEARTLALPLRRRRT